MVADFFKPELPDETIFHVGVSGGKDSTAVLLWMVHESGIAREKLDVTFCDTVNEHEWTIEQVQLLNDRVHPIQTLTPELGFFDLAAKRRRFPSARARFCTEQLKIVPTSRHITGLLAAAKQVVAVSGVRANESVERATLEEWDYSGNLLCLQWRPLIRWTIQDVLAIHKKYSIPLNPLYSMGAERVGCFPCVMSRKKEVRNITLNFPDRIARIREAEVGMKEPGRTPTFFHANTIPKRFRTEPFVTSEGESIMVANIDDVSRWSLTGKRAKGSYLDDPSEPIGCMSGFCE